MNCCIYTLDCNPGKEFWNFLFSHFVKVGDEFEIRCWNDQDEEIRKALKYGKISEEDNSRLEISIKGIVSDEMLEELIAETKPEDQAIDRKFIPYFTVTAGKRFSCSHYGTEIYLDNDSVEANATIIWALSCLEAQDAEYVYGIF